MRYKEIIKKNRLKSKIALGIYMIIYALIGVLLDFAVGNAYFGDTFTYRPFCLILMLIVAIVTIWVSIKYFDRILLQGDEYINIKEHSKDPTHRQIYNIVEELRIAARLSYTPKIYLIKASYMNAFASGWNENNTLVAVTTALVEKLTRDELMAVMAHELTHIRNEDVKLTLVVGVLTNVILFVANNMLYYRNYRLSSNTRSNQAYIAQLILLILSFVLPIITLLLQMYLSRSREYMADAGSVELTRDPIAMANALIKISGDYELYKYTDNNKARAFAYFFQKGDSFFSTHPNIKNRIAACLGREIK